MEEQVEKARQSQLEYIEYEKRCKLAKFNLYPRNNQNAIGSPLMGSPRYKMLGPQPMAGTTGFESNRTTPAFSAKAKSG